MLSDPNLDELIATAEAAGTAAAAAGTVAAAEAAAAGGRAVEDGVAFVAMQQAHVKAASEMVLHEMVGKEPLLQV